MTFAGASSPRIGGYLPTRIARLRAAASSGNFYGASTANRFRVYKGGAAGTSGRVSPPHPTIYGRAARKDVQQAGLPSARLRGKASGCSGPEHIAGVESRPCHLSPTTQPHRWLVVPMRGGWKPQP